MTSPLRHQVQNVDTYWITGVRVQQEQDGFSNHRVVVWDGDTSFASKWASYKAISRITVNGKTFFSVTPYRRGDFPPVFQAIYPHGITP